jgi:Ca2+-binding RTX toxin-like protein
MGRHPRSSRRPLWLVSEAPTASRELPSRASLLETRPVAAWLEAQRKDELALRAAVNDVRDWYEDLVASSPEPKRRAGAARRRPSAIRRRVAAVAAAAAIALPFATGGTAAAGNSSGKASSAGRFAGGKVVAASQLHGDGFAGRAWKAGSASSSASKFQGKKLGARHIQGDGDGPKGPMGDPPLVDGSGFRWHVNTNVGFPTSSSASGAVSEAEFTAAHPVSTLNGGTVNAQLSDAFDGYNGMAIYVGDPPPSAQVNTAAWISYNQRGPASTECSGRQVVYPPQVAGNLTLRRKVFVPSDDAFARWADYVMNNGGAPVQLWLQTSNNLGSDAGTQVVTTSDGDAVSELTDTWVTTFQNFSGTTSSDPRLGHVLQGPGAAQQADRLNFVNGDDNPYWGWNVTVAPGQTMIFLNYATGQNSRADAAAKAASLANAPPLTCLTTTEQSQVVNFDLGFNTPNKKGCTIFGTPGDDPALNGTAGNDIICADKGNDTVNGMGGNDVLYGGVGNDSLTDTSGTDRLVGGGGADTLNASDGAGGDKLNGSAGTDTCTSDGGDTELHCEA